MRWYPRTLSTGLATAELRADNTEGGRDDTGVWRPQTFMQQHKSASVNQQRGWAGIEEKTLEVEAAAPRGRQGRVNIQSLQPHDVQHTPQYKVFLFSLFVFYVLFRYKE